jgi:hypothetical protein
MTHFKKQVARELRKYMNVHVDDLPNVDFYLYYELDDVQGCVEAILRDEHDDQ